MRRCDVCGAPLPKSKTAVRQHKGAIRCFARMNYGSPSCRTSFHGLLLPFRLALGLPVKLGATRLQIEDPTNPYGSPRLREYKPYDNSKATVVGLNPTPWEKVMLEKGIDLAWVSKYASDLADPKVREELDTLSELDPGVALSEFPPSGVKWCQRYPATIAQVSDNRRYRIVTIKLLGQQVYERRHDAPTTKRGYASGKLVTPKECLEDLEQRLPELRHLSRASIDDDLRDAGKRRRMNQWTDIRDEFLKVMRSPGVVEHYRRAGVPRALSEWLDAKKVPYDLRQALVAYATSGRLDSEVRRFNEVAMGLFPDHSR